MIDSRGTHVCTFCHSGPNVVYQVRDAQPEAKEYKEFDKDAYIYVFSKNIAGRWQLVLYNNGEAKEIDFKNLDVDQEDLNDLNGQGSLNLVAEESTLLNDSIRKKAPELKERYQVIGMIVQGLNEYHQQNSPKKYQLVTANQSSTEIRVVVDGKFIVTFPAMITHYLNKADTQNMHGWAHPWRPEPWFIQAFLGGSKITFPATKEQVETLPEYRVGYLTTLSGEKESKTSTTQIVDTHGGDVHLPLARDEKSKDSFKTDFSPLDEKVSNKLQEVLSYIVLTASSYQTKKNVGQFAFDCPAMLTKTEDPPSLQSHQHFVRALETLQPTVSKKSMFAKTASTGSEDQDEKTIQKTKSKPTGKT